MIILPDRNIPHSRVLMPMLKREWMPPSVAVPKDEFGNDVVRTFFHIRARLHDGHIVWRGTFEDRNDFDAFLWAIATGSLRYERELWRLPTPQWSPDIGEELTFDFATVTFLTTTGSNQTYTSPSDWNNSNNSIECIGGAGSGGVGTIGHNTGGGAGVYSKITNFSFAAPGTTTATYRVGSGGASRTTTGVGNSGSSTWFNDTVDPGNGTTNAKCSADYGRGGDSNTGPRNGGAGGATTASWGQTKYAGGRGGNLSGSFGSGASGGGGAAGPSGAGGNGVDSASTSSNVSTAGGSANNGATAGGAGGTAGTAGSNGTEFDPSYGSGSGGGGGASASATTGGDGGLYGAGGGGVLASGTYSSGAGRQGLIVVTYTPATALISGNLAMMGM